jgi:CheY-like chemotaxis protein
MVENKRYKILIVDDDKFLLDMYATKFTSSGFEVVAAMGSMDGLDKLKGGFVPDVIITDVLMPAMDGFEFIENIKKNKLAENSKIVILSNKGEKQDIDKGVALGVEGYIIKASLIPSEVVEEINNILK